MATEKKKQAANEIELRSEEFQEILGSVPPWISRRGITLIGAIVVIILTGSAIFKYPDTITTTMTLTRTTPPVALIAKTNGKLQKLYVADKQTVEINDYIALIENPGRPEDIRLLKQYIETYNPERTSELPPKDLNLGNLQSLFSSFYITLSNYQEFNRLQYFSKKIESVKERVIEYETYYNNLTHQQTIIQEQLSLAESQYQRDLQLSQKGVLSAEELEISRSQYLQSALSLENIRSTLQNTQMQITQIKENLLDTEYQYEDRKNDLETQIKTYIAQLITEIQSWEQTFVFISPVNGEVTFTTHWAENQNVSAGETVFNIIPSEQGDLIGKAMMPMERSGKVKAGQKVNIRFFNFPDNEYGIVRGTVRNISLAPIKSTEEQYNYMVEIDLPEGLTTTYNKELPYHPEMLAQADIITDDLSVLERLILPLKKIITESL
ncbi:MAG: HlyD family secretion protein [Tannerellaceae bacterium]|nr:HlyD family secretion protein [Tannerellaceae bacterium]